MKEETSLDARYRAEGWGNLAAEAIGIRPQDVESQARSVARHASNLLSSVTLERDQWREACLAHGEKARAAEAERDQLRKIISECATACGAYIHPTCSVEFMALLPNEITAALHNPEKALERAAAIRPRTGGDARPSCDGPSSTAYDESGYAKEAK